MSVVDELWTGRAQCATCGVERAIEPVPAPLPELCPICADERQYLPTGGQRWVRPGDFPDARLELEQAEPGVWFLRQRDVPGIGQVPLLVSVPGGVVMLEPPAHIDQSAVDAVRALGGLQAIVASHPHMYGLQSAWSAAFGDCPVYVSGADEQWLGLRPANCVVWDGERQVAPGLVASQPGGHFPGSVVLHWTAPDGAGVLFTGDTIMPVPAAGWVTFMRSYPNQVPLSAAVVRRVAEHVARYDFDRLYGNFGGHVDHDAREAVLRSADRYARWVSGEFDHLT